MRPQDIQQAIGLFQSGDIASSKDILQQYIAEFPDDVNANMLSAAISAREGRFDAVVAACGRVLAMDANHMAANYNAAVACEKLDRFDDAVRYARAVIAMAPAQVPARLLLLRCLFAAGRNEEAAVQLPEALSSSPTEALMQGLLELYRAHAALPELAGQIDAATSAEPAMMRYYGIVLCLEQGDTGSAGDLFAALTAMDTAAGFVPRAGIRLALAAGEPSRGMAMIAENLQRLPPVDVDLYRKLVAACLAEGAYDQGIRLLQQAISAGQNLSECYHNLSILHDRAGNLPAAIQAAEEALKLVPASLNSRYNLAFLYDRAGNKTAALENIRACIEGRDDVRFAEACTDLLSTARVSDLGEADMAMLARLLTDKRIDPQLLTSITVDLLLHSSPALRRLYELADVEGSEFHRVFLEQEAQITGEPLLRDLYANLPVTRYDFELLTRRLRESLLRRYHDSGNLGDDAIALCCALGIRCYINGFVYVVRDAERELLAAVLERSAGSAAALAVLSMYRPLGEAAADIGVLQQQQHIPYCTELLELQVFARQREDELISGINIIGQVEDETSLRVRQQYEGNPYPVWQRLTRREPRPLSEVLGSELSPQLDLSMLPERPQVLVAGCGTGSHPIQVAMRYECESIFAIDLSLRSLAFAERKAQEYGIGHISFNMMDILNVAELGRSFDVIESVGVIHHMQDPQQGLQRLAAVLEPGGLCNLGFYSKLGRRAVIAAKQEYDSGGLSDDDIRDRRVQIMQAGGERAGAIRGFKDFYMLHDCRDLLFHENENNYDTLEIEAMLQAAELEFLGFEHFDRAVMPAYRRMFPQDPFGLSLSNWVVYEEKFPDTFASMYMFWCRKPA